MVRLEPRPCKSGHVYDDPPCCSYPHGKVTAIAALFALLGVLFSVPPFRRCSFAVREVEIQAGSQYFSREFDFGIWYVKGRWNTDFAQGTVPVSDNDECYSYPDGFDLDTPFEFAQGMSIVALILGVCSFFLLNSYACNIWPSNKRIMAACALFMAVACSGLTFMVLQTKRCSQDSLILPSGLAVDSFKSSCSVGTDGILTGIGMAMYFIAGVITLTFPEGQMPESKPAVGEPEP